MIAWLAARCDFPDYGKMLFYELPKEKLIYGPNQISAMIDQSTTISQQLTLWDQKGSGVIRGKLIVIPIENSFLYVVPLYLKAEGTNFPQLKRVIVATGDKVVMEPTLDESLSALFGTSPASRCNRGKRAGRKRSCQKQRWTKPEPNLRKRRKQSIRSKACWLRRLDRRGHTKLKRRSHNRRSTIAH